jgi:glucose-6-phosphate isomerase
MFDKRPCLTVLFPKVDAYAIGQFIIFYEVSTSFAGSIFKINTYDQPAVELGKHATFALMGKTGPCKYLNDLPYEQLAERIRSKTGIDRQFMV